MFAKLSDTIARSFVARGTISEERFSICRYGIKQLFSVCLNLLTTLCIGMAFGLVWESVLFTAAYIPLRSFAGGFHAKTPVRCYWYSAAMIAIVLALLRFVPLPLWTAVPVYMISSILLWLLVPVETSHKPLDELEQRVYRHRARLIWCVESLVMIGLFFLQLEQAGNCILLSMAALSVMLAAGKFQLHHTHRSQA